MAAIRHFLLVAAILWLDSVQPATARPQKSTLTTPEVCPNLIEATLAEVRRGLNDGCFSSLDLVEAYLERISEAESQSVSAVAEVNPDARSIARSIDDRSYPGPWKNDIKTWPLAGIPILLDDSIATKDKLNTTAGSSLLIGAQVPEDSKVAQKLREAGAIILGKSSMSEWGGMRSMDWTNGWSARGGQVLGAYYERQDPGGSAGGSAVATDLGLAFGAVAVDTTGSVITSASRNGIVAIRPTTGLVSTDLVIPLSKRLDSVSTMARTVKDAAHMLDAISEKDHDYATVCEDLDLRGINIGWPIIPDEVANVFWLEERSPFGATLERKEYRNALKTLSNAGATLVPINMSEPAKQIADRSSDVVAGLQADFAADVSVYLKRLTTNPWDIHSVEDILNRTTTVAKDIEEWPQRDTKLWEMVAGKSINQTNVNEAWKRVEDWTNSGVVEAIKQENLSAMFFPTALMQAAGVGLPSVTMPLGNYPQKMNKMQSQRMEGLTVEGPGGPFGASFVGKHNSERELIRLACAFESLWPARASFEQFKGMRRLVRPKTQLRGGNCLAK